jgi:hypothetical protein
MAGHQGQHLGMVAVGERNSGVGRAGRRRRYPGHHFVVDAGRAQRFDFLATAAEDEGIAALEPHR